MEKVEILTLAGSILDKYARIRRDIATMAYVVLCFRGCLGWLGVDTLFLTLFLNFLILLALDYKKCRPLFLLIPFISLLVVINKQILGVVDVLVVCMILKKENYNKLVYIYITILFLFITIWQFLLNNGFIISLRWFNPVKGEFFDYGFANPNGLGMLGFHLISTIYLIFRRKCNFFIIMLILIVNQICYYYSFSRTAWLGGLVLVLSIFLLKIKVFKPWTRYPLAILPVLMTVFLVYVSKNVTSFQALDIITSHRLTIYNSVVSKMSMVNWIIGFKLPEGAWDGSYMMLLFYGGLFTSVIYWVRNYIMMIDYFNNIKIFLPFILGIMACGVTESTFAACSGLSVLYWFLLLNCNRVHSPVSRYYSSTVKIKSSVMLSNHLHPKK